MKTKEQIQQEIKELEKHKEDILKQYPNFSIVSDVSNSIDNLTTKIKTLEWVLKDDVVNTTNGRINITDIQKHFEKFVNNK